MNKRLNRLPSNVAAVLTFGRPPLVFLAFACTLWLMFSRFPVAYMLGLTFLLLALVFDWMDGWFAERYLSASRLGPLVDRMMDRLVLTIIFPVLAAGMFWRLGRMQAPQTLEVLHAVFVLSIAVLVLMRDQVAHFLRSFREGPGQESEDYELTRLRAMVASPLAVLLYARAFYQPTDGWEWFYRWVDWVDHIPMRVWFVAEIGFLVITLASVTLYLRKYGRLALNEICEDNEVLRRRILSVVPNTVTLMNGVLGITAIVFADHGRVREAIFVLLGAAFLDRLDGLMARRLGLTDTGPKTGRGITTGALLDDISDAVSFAIAPGAIFYIVISDLAPGVLPAGLVLVLAVGYTLAGIGRLIYFTLDTSPVPGFFKGIPVPAAALLAGASIEMAYQASLRGSDYLAQWVWLSAGTMVLAAVVMVLFAVRFLHIGRMMSRRPVLMRSLVVLSIVMVFTPYFGHVLFGTLLIYLVSPFFTGGIDPQAANSEQPASAETAPQ